MINRYVKGRVLCFFCNRITFDFFLSRFSSPFNVQVLPHFEPHKVIVDGTGVRNGVPASLETSFRIDTRDAGVEQVDVSIKVKRKQFEKKNLIKFSVLFFFLLHQNPEGLLVSSKTIDNNDGTYKIIYKPNDVGRYLINVNYGGIPVQNSPFSVKVEPTGDPTKCHISGRITRVSFRSSTYE